MTATASKHSPRFRLWFAAVCVLALALPLGALADNNEKDFSLSVKLNDPFNSHFELCFPILVNKSFRATSMNHGIKNSFSGVLSPSVDGKYRMTLTISEWESERRNSKEAGEHKLKPDQPEDWGVVQSIVYQRSVLLSKGGCK